MAVFPLELRIRNLVKVERWVMPIRVAESMNRYSPVGSRLDLMNLKQSRACSMLPAHRRYSAPTTNSSSSRIQAPAQNVAGQPSLAVPPGQAQGGGVNPWGQGRPEKPALEGA